MVFRPEISSIAVKIYLTGAYQEIFNGGLLIREVPGCFKLIPSRF